MTDDQQMTTEAIIQGIADLQERMLAAIAVGRRVSIDVSRALLEGESPDGLLRELRPSKTIEYRIRIDED